MSGAIDPGALRDRVLIRRPSRVRDPLTGAETISYDAGDYFWAALGPARQDKSADGAGERILTRRSCRLRADAVPALDDRLDHLGRAWCIRGVTSDTSGAWLQLDLEEMLP